MEKLLQSYDLTEILFFIVIAAAAIKGVVSFVDWAKERSFKWFHKATKQEQDSLQQEKLVKEIQELGKKVDTLIASDRDDIKAYLTEKHHFFCYEQEWIDDYSLESCEKRYGHYVQEGGNSFIANFMEDLRKLPKQPKK